MLEIVRDSINSTRRKPKYLAFAIEPPVLPMIMEPLFFAKFIGLLLQTGLTNNSSSYLAGTDAASLLRPLARRLFNTF